MEQRSEHICRLIVWLTLFQCIWAVGVWTYTDPPPAPQQPDLTSYLLTKPVLLFTIPWGTGAVQKPAEPLGVLDDCQLYIGAGREVRARS